MNSVTPSITPTALPEKSGMHRSEIIASTSLASIFALRMFGLFLIMPIFTEHAKSLPDGADIGLVGLAMGIYGFSQALAQIPFGMASDRFGRKPVIIIGLLLFALGALIAALSTTVLGIAIGRAIQGSGAISAAVTALISDSTREEHRTKAMAMVGGSIGLSFTLSLVLAPLLYKGIGMSGIFYMTMVLALIAIAVVIFITPNPPAYHAPRVPFSQVLKSPELMRLNFGVFVLHMCQVAMFVVIPSALIQSGHWPMPEHWKIYLPAVFGSFLVMLPMIIWGERKGQMKKVFVISIALLLFVQIGFINGLNSPTALIVLLCLFFLAFNILEASQPSLVSRFAPAAAKGSALGVYSTMQALGLACGGILGGKLNQHFGPASVFILCAIFCFAWLIIAKKMPAILARSKK
jgi:MFS family permease